MMNCKEMSGYLFVFGLIFYYPIATHHLILVNPWLGLASSLYLGIPLILMLIGVAKENTKANMEDS